MNAKKSLTGCLLLWLGLAARGQAQTFTLPTVADTFLREGGANQTGGGDAVLQLSGNQRVLLRVDQAAIASAVGSGRLVSASLELWVRSASGWGNDGRAVEAHRLTADWTEAGATWNCAVDTQPTNGRPDCATQWDGGTFEEDSSDTILQTNDDHGRVQLDVTADVAAFLAGTPNRGWLLEREDDAASGRADYTSREGAAAERPRLVLLVETAANDQVPPSLAITSPVRSILVNEPSPTVTLEYADGGSGVDTATLQLLVDNQDVTARCTAGAQSASCPLAALAAGNHTLLARLGDHAGNTAQASFSFQLLLGAGPHLVTFQAIGDTYLRKGGANQNQGAEPVLRLREGGQNRSLVQFDAQNLATTLAGATLVSAALELHVEKNGRNWGKQGRTVDVHRVTTAWTELGATWNCPVDSNPSNGQADCAAQWNGGSFAAAPTASVLHTRDLTGWVSFNVTADVAAFTSGTPNRGWLLKKTDEKKSGRVDYDSRQGTAGEGPRLVVVFTTPTNGDTTPPSLAIIEPDRSPILYDQTPQVRVTYSDGGSGVDLGSLRVSVAGIDLTATCQVGSSEAICEPPPLPSGPVTVRAEIRDRAGNPAQVSRDYELILEPEAPPTVTITAPAAGKVFGSASVTVEGTAQDDRGVVSVEVNGAPATLAGTTFRASVELSAGFNTLTAVAVDATGMTGSATVTVALDTEPPLLAVDAPLPGERVNGPTVRVVGKADDDFGLAGVTVNGTAAPLTDGRFEAEVALVEGTNSVAVRATDLAGNVRDLAREVKRFTVPTITITSPADLSRTTAVAVDVTGTVSGPAASVVVEGIPATVSGNTFTAQHVPLAVGGNFLAAVATSANGAQASAKVTVLRDLVPPEVAIYEPRDGEVVFDATVQVSGLVNDIVLGTVNSMEATVTVNGIPAQVANRGFLASGVPLSPGDNLITVTARDPTGNSAQAKVRVTRAAPGRPVLRRVSGDLQTATVGTLLPAPLVVRLTDAAGQPTVGTVYFRVSEGSGMLGAGRRQLALPTDASGFAQVTFTLGRRSGAGNQKVEATAAGFAGRVVFTASGMPGPAANLFLDDGDQQLGLVSQVLPDPLVAVVTDAGFNRLAGVPVTFRVVRGDGLFANGESEITANSDTDGRVAAELRLGAEPGVATDVVQAFLATPPGRPGVSFTATGVAAGDPAQTSISGVVLDNMNEPVPGVTLRLLDTSLTAQADERGFFRIAGAPVGTFRLVADGSTARRPGLWPDLEFIVTTLPGYDNTLGMPIYLLPIDEARGVLVNETQGGVLTLPDFPGFSLEIAAGSVTFPGGGRSGVVSATVVHADRVPMVPNFGQQPRFILTIQPAGAAFDPPARLTLPNVDGLAPGQVTEMYSFDHDLASFVSIGPATVSEDGAVLVSNPGVGIVKAGWHCGGDSASSGTTHDCPKCQRCDNDTCVADAAQNGGSCDDDGDRCTEDICANGSCTHRPRECPECQRCRDGNCSADPARNQTACQDEGDPACTIDRCRNGTCEHTQVDPVTPYNPDPPGLDVNGMTADTQTAMTCLQNAVAAAGGNMVVTSGFRPQAYQDHLREVFRKHQQLAGWTEAECAQVNQNVNQEFARHQIVREPVAVSNHTQGNAFDATVVLPAGQNVDTLARGCNLTRPEPVRDRVHFRR